VARYFNQRTVLGRYLDPIADKLLVASAFTSLAILNIVPSWLTVIVISRDVLIVGGIAVIKFSDIPFNSGPSTISKCTTIFQILTIFWILLYPDLSETSTFIQIFYWLTASLTIVSGLHYVYMGMNLLQNALENSDTSSDK
jgi:cardiolipin synthase